MLDFVAEAWATVPDDTVVWSFRGCGTSNAVDGYEEGDLHGGLAGVGARAPGVQGGLEVECCKLFFGTDSEEYFDVFESDDYD